LIDALACGPEQWDAMLASSGSSSPFMRWAWHDAWAASASAEELRASFAILLGDPNAPANGVFPLALRSLSFRRARVTALTWAIGSVGCPDHLDLPLPLGAPLDDVMPLLEALPWDLMMLGGVADAAPNVTRLTEAFACRGYIVRRTPLDTCPWIDLPNSWEAYLAGLSASRRESIRRQERRRQREPALTLTDYAPDRVDEGWGRLRSLHSARWSGAGAIGEPRLDCLLRRFSGRLAASSELWLTTLDLDGEPVAAWHGFAQGDTVYFYQSGRDPAHDSRSVGTMLMTAMIRRAIERGFRRFDMLRGDDSYKKDCGAVMKRPIHEVVVFRPGWRGVWLRALDWVGRMRARLRSRPEFAGG
jgi:CelD/BcsL family acetyltransferase involved in cellulose biosynthesis